MFIMPVIVRGLLVAALVFPAAVALATVTIDMMPVGNPGNAGEQHYSTGKYYGAVPYSYQIGTYEVTAGQYTEFLNAKAATDTYGLYRSWLMWSNYDSKTCQILRSGTSGSYTYSVAADYANRPVIGVTWFSCLRFVNWLQNGQGDGDTETGTYTLIGDGSNLYWTVSVPDAATRANWAATDPHWVLPTEDEWYKAAYYDPNKPGGAGYYDYPTKSDTPPTNSLLSPDPGNHANFFDRNDGYTIGYPYYRTEVGAFTNSASAYGTFDQGGNVAEWNETATDRFETGSYRGIRGGSYGSVVESLKSTEGGGYYPTVGGAELGFRVAYVPEPGSLVMLGGMAVTVLLYRWRKHVQRLPVLRKPRRPRSEKGRKRGQNYFPLAEEVKVD